MTQNIQEMIQMIEAMEQITQEMKPIIRTNYLGKETKDLRNDAYSTGDNTSPKKHNYA